MKYCVNLGWAYVHLSQPGTGNHVFHFSFWSSCAGLKIIIPFLSPLSFSLFFSFLFVHPFAFSLFYPLLRKCSLVLGHCHQELFLEPFSFLFIWFRFCIVLVFYRSFAFKIVLGKYRKELFSNPFRFFPFLHPFGYVSFLCLENWPWKLPKGAFSRTFFVLFCLFFCFGYFSSSAFKIDLGNCQKELFLKPFSCFFRFGYFSLPFSHDRRMIWNRKKIKNKTKRWKHNFCGCKILTRLSRLTMNGVYSVDGGVLSPSHENLLECLWYYPAKQSNHLDRSDGGCWLNLTFLPHQVLCTLLVASADSLAPPFWEHARDVSATQRTCGFKLVNNLRIRISCAYICK